MPEKLQAKTAHALYCHFAILGYPCAKSTTVLLCERMHVVSRSHSNLVWYGLNGKCTHLREDGFELLLWPTNLFVAQQAQTDLLVPSSGCPFSGLTLAFQEYDLPKF